MKRVYERPVMMAEVYETNAYCGMCSANPQVAYFETSADKCYRNDRHDSWQPNGFGITAGDLSHTFSNVSNPSTSTGHCTEGHQNKEQSIWKCDGKCGETWFLEWSHHYSVDKNDGKQDVFFLYKDDGDGEFEIINFGGSYPHQDPGTDINVAMVDYGKVMVANS